MTKPKEKIINGHSLLELENGISKRTVQLPDIKRHDLDDYWKNFRNNITEEQILKFERQPGISPNSLIRRVYYYHDTIWDCYLDKGPEDVPVRQLSQDYWKFIQEPNCRYNFENGDFIAFLSSDLPYNIYSYGYDRGKIRCDWYPVRWVRINRNVSDWVVLKLKTGIIITVEPDFKFLMERSHYFKKAKDIKKGEWLYGAEAGYFNQVIDICYDPPKTFCPDFSISIGVDNGIYNIYDYPVTSNHEIKTEPEELQENEFWGKYWKHLEKVE